MNISLALLGKNKAKAYQKSLTMTSGKNHTFTHVIGVLVLIGVSL